MKLIKTYEQHNYDLDMIKRNQMGNELIYYCSKKSALNHTRKLLSEGADPNFENNIGHTPLHYACTNFLVNVVKLLIENGADVNKKSKKNITPFFMLSTYAHSYSYIKNKIKINKIIDLLIENGANISIKAINSVFFDEMAHKDFIDYIKVNHSKEYEEFLMVKEAEKYNL